jgi:hypothetical protein
MADLEIIVPPDRALRRRVLLGIALFAAVGLWGMLRLEDHLDQVLAAGEENALERLLHTLQLLLYALAGGLVGFAGWLLWLSRRVLRAGQFPLPGQRVIRPTPLRTGSRARRLAWGMVLSGLLLLALVPVTIYLGVALPEVF